MLHKQVFGEKLALKRPIFQAQWLKNVPIFAKAVGIAGNRVQIQRDRWRPNMGRKVQLWIGDLEMHSIGRKWGL